jgi:hypothetical protein
MMILNTKRIINFCVLVEILFIFGSKTGNLILCLSVTSMANSLNLQTMKIKHQTFILSRSHWTVIMWLYPFSRITLILELKRTNWGLGYDNFEFRTSVTITMIVVNQQKNENIAGRE